MHTEKNLGSVMFSRDGQVTENIYIFIYIVTFGDIFFLKSYEDKSFYSS